MYNYLILFSHDSYSSEVLQDSYFERLLEYFFPEKNSISKSFEVWVYYEKK